MLMKRNITHKEMQAMQYALACSFTLIECIDTLGETYLFTQSLKQKAKGFLKELEKVLDKFYDPKNKIHKIDWEAESEFYQMVNAFQDILANLHKLPKEKAEHILSIIYNQA